MSMPHYYFSVDTMDKENLMIAFSESNEGCSVANVCASAYHYSYGGLERSFPLNFFIFDNNKKFIGEFEVKREAEPVFSATEKN